MLDQITSLNLKHILTCEGSWQAANMLPNLSNVVTALLADRAAEGGGTWQLTNELPSLSNVVTALADRHTVKGG
jgi:hypothetical protein